MSYNSSLNPDAVKTAIDDIFMQKFSGELSPGYANAEDAMVFRQDTAEHQAVILDIFKGVGAWQARTEEQDVPEGDPRISNQKTFTILNWAKSVDIPKNFFDDQMHKQSTVHVKLGELLGSLLKEVISSRAVLGIA